MSASARVVIVGGGPAAHSAAAAYREAGGDGRLLMLTDDDRPPYRRPPLSKELLRGEMPISELPLAEAGWYRDTAVEVRCSTTVTGIDTRAGTVRTGTGERIAYEACLLATGSAPARPPVPGVRRLGVHVLRTVRQALALREATTPGARAVVVGSGFVGCEAAASLAMRGARVTMVTVEEAPQAERLGAEVAGRVAGWLADLGVGLLPGRAVAGIAEDGGALRVDLPDGAVHAEVVLLATGARPQVGPARDAGIALHDGAVVTDSAMRTSAAGVWCAGDAALAQNASAGRRLQAEHWGEALAQGAVAGRVMAGREDAWDAVPGFWSTIGGRTLKQAAWGDGWDDVRFRDHGDGAFTAWYGRAGRIVGVLAHGRDDDYERGAALVRAGAAWPPP